MKEITVKMLAELCAEQIKAGNGDKIVLISCDDEGNGFHTLYYGFTTDEEAIRIFAAEEMFHDGNDAGKVVLLG